MALVARAANSKVAEAGRDPAKLGALCRDPLMSVCNEALAVVATLDGDVPADVVKTVSTCMKVPIIRQNAINALGKMGKAGAAHVMELAEYIEDSDVKTRLAVAHTLGCMKDSVPKAVVDRLASMLDHQSDRFRATAALMVGEVGATQYEGTLKKMLRENVADRQDALSPCCAAATALGKMGKAAELVPFLAAKGPMMRATVCETLASLGTSQASAIAERLKDPEAVVRAAALKALGRIKEDGGSLDAAVIKAMGDAA
mmetsp:Transcript_107799/g.304781  ORF Transcript_107799/g.304781 Transcript_107799/m.304781 type:complete len:258 (+) Transcript_107799:86-859(+)